MMSTHRNVRSHEPVIPVCAQGAWRSSDPHAKQDDAGNTTGGPDTCCPEMDNAGITATSHGSGVERTVQQEYRSAM